ncbi:MAG: hypothetical protein AAF607_03720 [Pseudomonadota bacterium]
MERLAPKATQKLFNALAVCTALCLTYSSAAGAAPDASASTAGADTVISAVSATQLQVAGRYQEAISAGLAEDSFDGFIAAAKSGLFLAAYEEKNKKRARELLRDATEAAKAAVALRPDDVDANLQLSIAEGYYARIKTSIGRAKKARARAEQLVEAAPDNGYVLGLLGGWHGEAIAAYGKLIADVTVGADVAEFEKYFDAAIAASPNNALITAYYTRLLLDINDPGMREKAQQLLVDIEQAQPHDAFEGFMKDRALALKQALALNETKTLKRLIKSQRAFRDQK